MLPICNIRSAPRTQREGNIKAAPLRFPIRRRDTLDIIALCNVFLEKLLKYHLREATQPPAETPI